VQSHLHILPESCRKKVGNVHDKTGQRRMPCHRYVYAFVAGITESQHNRISALLVHTVVVVSIKQPINQSMKNNHSHGLPVAYNVPKN